MSGHLSIHTPALEVVQGYQLTKLTSQGYTSSSKALRPKDSATSPNSGTSSRPSVQTWNHATKWGHFSIKALQGVFILYVNCGSRTMTVVVNIDCQLDRVWNHIGDKPLDRPLEDYLY